MGLKRETFTTSRLLDFFSEKELIAQVGHPVRDWPLMVVKELIDNALDACEGPASGRLSTSPSRTAPSRSPITALGYPPRRSAARWTSPCASLVARPMSLPTAARKGTR
jgi:hypothetical protein